ncbi:hypothetical protein BDN67DRAFT_1050640 [Paxillus ammoniavirescens]|nr:hypothetical protein BDN67DRAFT_1050640 [Paxillus ammoniavirescens]
MAHDATRKGHKHGKGCQGLVQCSCCGQLVSPSTARQHLLGRAKPHIKATAMFTRNLLSVAGPSSCHSGSSRVQAEEQSHPPPDPQGPGAQIELGDSVTMSNDLDPGSVGPGDENLASTGDEDLACPVSANSSILSSNIEPPIHSTLERVRSSRQGRSIFSATVESEDEDTGDDNFGITSDSEHLDGWISEDEDSDEGDFSGLSAWDALGQSFEQDVADMGMILN